MTGDVVGITGIGSMGKAIAWRIRASVSLILAKIDRAKLQSFAAAMAEYGYVVLPIAIDVSIGMPWSA